MENVSPHRPIEAHFPWHYECSEEGRNDSYDYDNYERVCCLLVLNSVILNVLTALLLAALLRRLGLALHHFSVWRTRMRNPLT